MKKTRSISGLALAAALTLLAACGERPADARETAREGRASQRTVTDALGKTLNVPLEPKRVVALSEIDLDAALALGMRPVGTTNGRGQKSPPPYLAAQSRDIRSVGNFNQPSLDRIVSLQPDLILAGGNTNAELLEQLRRIAPTAATFMVGESWRQTFLRIAKIAGRETQAHGFLNDYQRRADQIKAALGNSSGASVSIVRWTPQGPVYMLSDAFASRVLADVGLTRPASQRRAGAGHSSPLSLEALHLIDADWIVLGSFDSHPVSLADLRREPAFSQLNAVKAGRVVSVDASLWTVTGGPLAAIAVLDDIERALLPRQP